MCVGVAKSAVVMRSVVQLCCYFVVCSFVHSFSTHSQLVREEVEAGQSVTKLESEVDKLQKEIDDIQKEVRREYDNETPGFQKVLGRIFYNGKIEAFIEGFRHLANLEERLKVCNTCFPHSRIFSLSIRNMCVGVAKSAVVMRSVVQLCCYFVVCSFVHSFSTHLQSVNNQLESVIRIFGYVSAVAAQQQPFDLDVLAKMDTPLCIPSTQKQEKRFGREGFNKVLVSTVEGITDGMTMQETRALVLACGSGVGKTFGTLTARQGFQEQDKKKKYNPVVAYIGFNCRSLMSEQEEDFLEDIPTSKSIRVLLCSRLFAWLNAYRKLKNPDELDTENSDVQKQFELPTLTEEQLRRVHLSTIESKVREILEQLAKEQRTLVLIIVVDEGQMLDERCPDGARFALKYLRELQKDMGVRVKVLPVCTGIDPQTHLSDAKEGKNISLSTQEEALLSQEEFRQLVSNAWKKVVSEERTKGRKVSDDDIRLFAAFAWPRARMVMEMQGTKNFTIYPNSTTLLWEKGMDVRRVLQAAADGKTLERGAVPRNMVRLVQEEEMQLPLIDYSLLHSIIDRLNIPYFFRCFPDTVNLQALSPDDRSFEAIAFQTLALFLGFFFHNRVDNRYLPVESTTQTLRTWFPPSVCKVVQVQKLDKPKSQSHPFNTQSHNERTALSVEFEGALLKLCKHGDTILVHCGGSAAMDFILVTLEKKKTNHTLQIRFADAKFKTDPTEKWGTTTQKTQIVKEAEKVHESLQAILKNLKNPKNLEEVERLKKCSVAPWEDQNFLLITNSETEGDCVMSPLTTTWEPMTTLLYSSTGKEEVPEVKAFAPSSLLSSRPVWPALLSRGSHIPNHMWKTPLPPTRAMMTRHVPFFRRICKLI